MATASVEPRTAAANAPSRRLAAIMRMADAFERNEIESAIDGLIAVLDARDGDTDMEDDDRGAVMMFADGSDMDFDNRDPSHPAFLDEENGDECDTGNGEDEPQAGFACFDPGPGCPIADPAEYAYAESYHAQPETLNTYGSEDEEPSSASILAYHRARIQRTRCDVIVSRYRLHTHSFHRLRAPMPSPSWSAA